MASLKTHILVFPHPRWNHVQVRPGVPKLESSDWGYGWSAGICYQRHSYFENCELHRINYIAAQYRHTHIHTRRNGKVTAFLVMGSMLFCSSLAQFFKMRFTAHQPVSWPTSVFPKQFEKHSTSFAYCWWPSQSRHSALLNQQVFIRNLLWLFFDYLTSRSISFVRYVKWPQDSGNLPNSSFKWR